MQATPVEVQKLPPIRNGERFGEVMGARIGKTSSRIVFRERVEMDSNFKIITRKVLLNRCRSEAYIKNKFYGGLRKALRRIN